MPTPAHGSLTTGNPIRPLLRLAAPFLAGNLLNLVVLLVDRLWVGEVGTTALAALGVAHVALMVMGTVTMGMGIGTLAGVARHVGRGEHALAGRYYGRGMLLAVGFGLAFAALAFVLPAALMRFMGADAALAAPAADYLRVSMWGLLFQAPMFVQNFALQGAGEGRAALLVSTVAPVVNAVLDPLLIFGLGMGVEGAAWASNVAYAMGLATGAWLIARAGLRLTVTRASFTRGAGSTRAILRVGLPSTLEQLVRTLAAFSLVKVLTPFGETVLSAYTAAMVLAMALVFPGLAIGQAAASLMGQNLGVGEPRRAWHTAWLAVLLYGAMISAAGVLIYVFAAPLIAAFDDNPTVVAEGATLLRVQVFCYPALAVALVLSKAFGGAGNTKPAMVSAVIGHLVWQIPAAWYFGRLYGPIGAYWAMASAYVVHGAIQAVLFVARFRPGGRLAQATVANHAAEVAAPIDLQG